MRESAILHQCMLALSEAGCTVFRAQVGTFFTKDGRPVRIGVPGFSDLHGHRPDGRAFYVEVKSNTGKLRNEQRDFLMAMLAAGAIAVVTKDAHDCVQQVLRFKHQ